MKRKPKNIFYLQALGLTASLLTLTACASLNPFENLVENNIVLTCNGTAEIYSSDTIKKKYPTRYKCDEKDSEPNSQIEETP